MTNKYRKLYLPALLALFMSQQAAAQSELSSFVKGGVADANKLMKGYLSPFGESFGVNMNNGWVNTAAPLKPGRFELKLVTNLAFVPAKHHTYNLDALGFNQPSNHLVYGMPATERWEYQNPVAPTVFGASSETSTIRKTLTYLNPETGQMETEELARLPLPGGIGFGANPLPFTPQLSVGLPLKTEIMLRYLPAVNANSGDASFDFKGLWGVGLKHDFKQWIPGIKSLPFSLSTVAAYSSTNFVMETAPILPEAPAGGAFADPAAAGTGYTGPSVTATDYSGQGASFRASAWNVSVLASKKVSIISGYAGLRYSKSVTRLTMTGIYGVAGEPYYNLDNENDPNNQKYMLINTEKDPIKVNMPMSQIGLVGGFRLKLGIMSLFAEGTWSEYSTVSAGFGFGWFN